MSLTRRIFLGAVATFVAASSIACKKEPRCAHCGMKLDPMSTWTTELAGGTSDKYDTPRCAFAAWRGGRSGTTGIRAIEYYDRVPKDGADLVFVVGSDVLGPMGPDAVPVAPDRAARFVKDHGGRALKPADVTSQVIGDST